MQIFPYFFFKLFLKYFLTQNNPPLLPNNAGLLRNKAGLFNYAL